ncbi:HTH-type transcriptional activator CmpR [Novipirellula aureliae]|uniref:HTH-type transcriptional activator CmpR n=1 Tax=Novipirellula aureliae TaxID=2527966 RepID=A0A5C6EC73_9BACT|nr:LysR family transcriptional regulator [Novipirellula aureliae]TWU45136.1 HTH-type transcriptional activator CmpR [Novipirellula aureliae]
MPELNHLRADSLTIQQISTFCRVYEHGSYAGAAEELGLATPTIWEQVKTLEKIYQTKLFARSGRSIVSTLSGDALYEMLRPLLANVASTFDRLAEQADQSATHIRLVTGSRMMMEELGTPLARFQKEYPNATMRLRTADNATAQRLILDGHADLALLIEPPKNLIAEGIDYQSLYPLEYLAALPPRHRLIRHSQLTLEDLQGEPLIVGSSQTIGRQQFEQAHFRLGLSYPLRIVAETDNSAITIACVRAGLGVGIIASHAAGHLTRAVKTRSLAHQLGQVNVVAAFRKGRQLTNALQTLVDLIRG